MRNTSLLIATSVTVAVLFAIQQKVSSESQVNPPSVARTITSGFICREADDLESNGCAGKPEIRSGSKKQLAGQRITRSHEDEFQTGSLRKERRWKSDERKMGLDINRITKEVQVKFLCENTA